MTDLIKINEEVRTQLANPEILKTLVATTFKGLAPAIVPQAITEGMMRGFNFKDFLEKNIYAIPFGAGYSLVTSIDYARKIGAKSGVVGKSAPVFEEKEGVNGKSEIISCSITVKKKTGEYIGDYSATVFFNEYTTGRNQWISKPRTMIAKVAEMHALRMACPELAQNYAEEEMEREVIQPVKAVLIEDYRAKIASCKTLGELQTVWAGLPQEARQECTELKNDMKEKLTPKEKVKKTESLVQPKAEEDAVLKAFGE